MVDANEYFIPENATAQLGTRRTGLGTMGLADALIKMELRYGHEESLPVIERVYRTIRDAAYECSAALGRREGAVPLLGPGEVRAGRVHRAVARAGAARSKIAETGTRNAVLLTQAPTGSTSLLSGVSSGIEPVYDFAFVRRDRIGEHVIYHPLLQEWKEAHPDAETAAVVRERERSDAGGTRARAGAGAAVHRLQHQQDGQRAERAHD